MKKQPAISSEEKLSAFETILNTHNIPIKNWTGDKGTKTVEDLFNEVASGETEIEIDPNDEVLRIVHVVAGDVTYIDENSDQMFRLRENRQVFKQDGRVKRRPHLHGAVAEKMKAGEDPVAASIRGIEEELGITGNFIVGSPETIKEKRATPTYPGLMSIYKIHVVPVQIDEANFRSEGYIEEQETKTSYFVWNAVVE